MGGWSVPSVVRERRKMSKIFNNEKALTLTDFKTILVQAFICNPLERVSFVRNGQWAGPLPGVAASTPVRVNYCTKHTRTFLCTP
jgi:hypothetical protein